MTDDKWCFISNSRDKKSIAASAHKQRTHCGKDGRAKLPHERLTKKELMKLNGEIKEYKMNEPISWKEFKKMPDDLKVKYVNNLRDRFRVPDKFIAEMMGIGARQLALVMVDLKNTPTHKGRTNWDREGFEKWKNGEEEKKIPVVTYDTPVGPKGESAPELFNGLKTRPVAPASGWLSFEDNDIYEIFEKIKSLIGRYNINATFTWEIAERGDS